MKATHNTDPVQTWLNQFVDQYGSQETRQKLAARIDEQRKQLNARK